MPKYKVTKGQDAWIYYITIVEADSIEEANKIAGSPDYEGKWEPDGEDEFDHYEIMEEDTEEVTEE